MEEEESCHYVKHCPAVACLDSRSSKAYCLIEQEYEGRGLHYHPRRLVADLGSPFGSGEVAVAGLEIEKGDKHDDSHNCHRCECDVVGVHCNLMCASSKGVQI